MAEQYLKCNSHENAPMMTFSDECLITFKSKTEVKNIKALIGEREWPPQDEDWCVVSKEDVISYQEEGYNALVKLVDLEMNEQKEVALVALRDLGDRRISYFPVPLEEIVIK